MSARGYSGSGWVQQAIGRDLTVNELGMLNGWLLESIENQIDRATGRTWLTGTVTAERYYLDGPIVYLKQRPITAVTLVTARDLLDTSTRVIVAGTDYAGDLATGRLVLADSVWPGGLSGYDYLEISYTVPGTVPADIMEAATIWAASSLSAGAGFTGTSGTIKSFSADGLQVAYRDPVAPGQIPDAVERILAGYARPALA